METKDFFQDKQKSINWQITLKVFIIGIIAIVLLVPKFMILGLIQERQTTAEITNKEVMQKWSLAQTVRGPVLSIPYIERSFDSEGKETREEIRECYILPKTLNIGGEIFPEKRKRSIYETVVYESGIEIGGHFDATDFDQLNIPANDVLWKKAKILVAISDLRGISDKISFNWNDSTFSFLPGMENRLIGNNGISLPLSHFSYEDLPGEFQFTLRLKGSESLNFAPLGETTEVALLSKWNDPGFEGTFLPAEHNIDNNGFTARWKILNFNRNFPQQWKNDEYRVTNADFGVKLVTVADHYQKSSRSAKYAIMVILFVFLSFFLSEIIAKQKIHPFQYILVGFAVLIFYLLLLSISEQLGFNLAYLISAVAVIIMVLFYSRTFLKTWMNSLIQTLILTFSFGFIFVLMQLETYALLVGSIGLFAVLGLTMFFTRKINWYNE
ncbi:cell envelope integrity protein CreD [Maribellus maritimus]|uniref:cell envelope integrity protein CreD n=1 Tax=Maribellus maritimus TaxID=2870838 RepID=UPI001EEC9734|nr:cell envelope integrity protein CreD [Maribellus maritimus]MCG6190813.1 cell envelope integrity protein CreD [Maribellus maritimus]